jgi:disulfide oxidoreductase YuzD
LSALERLKQSGGVQPIEGYLYKGEIPDEILPSFLDWDKPLSQQSEEVKKAFYLDKFPDAVYQGQKVADMTGAEVYIATGGRFGEPFSNSPKAAQYLEKKGLRGIRYLDQGSRAEGKGTSNFIPFRAEDYRIQEINDRPVEEFFPGLLDEPAQSVAEAPIQRAFTTVNPGDEVAGLTVREDVPNMSSIGATIENYEILQGIRKVPRKAFDEQYLSSLNPAKLDKRTTDLSEQIKQSKEINPLIVAVDNQGAYIIEGGHRFDALMTQKRESVPAVVVIDKDNPPTEEFLQSLLD